MYICKLDNFHIVDLSNCITDDTKKKLATMLVFNNDSLGLKFVYSWCFYEFYILRFSLIFVYANEII